MKLYFSSTKLIIIFEYLEAQLVKPIQNYLTIKFHFTDRNHVAWKMYVSLSVLIDSQFKSLIWLIHHYVLIDEHNWIYLDKYRSSFSDLCKEAAVKELNLLRHLIICSIFSMQKIYAEKQFVLEFDVCNTKWFGLERRLYNCQPFTSV